jgi:hypothetical protein
MIDLEKIYQNLLKNDMSSMMCFKHPSLDLIFFPHPKCASSTYRNFFTLSRWTQIDINNINWQQDKVFAHIKEPLTRHRKGIVEGICNYFPEVKEMFLTDLGAKFLTNITIVEAHSYTIEKWFGQKHAAMVDWIPIDTSLNHTQLTVDYLEQQGVEIDPAMKTLLLSNPKINESTADEVKLYNMLMSYETPGEILRYLDFDRCLYGQVLSLYNVEPEYYRSRVDQLKATGLGELDAQAQADQEVETGEFLNWFKDDQKDKFC